ncbi:MAG: hypothetical protein RJP95_00190, partial [Pirellulales bacterium]
MRNQLENVLRMGFLSLLFLLSLGVENPISAEDPPVKREILVPVDALDVLLEAGPRRVLLKRDEYDTLLRRAEKSSEEHPPHDALILSAEYQARIEREHVLFEGDLSLEVLHEGLHALDLDLEDIGLRSATLDGKPAPIGVTPGERPTLFVEGRGTHQLRLVILAPLDVAAATQSLRVTLPASATASLRLRVPGDVEVREGAVVVNREVLPDEGITEFELLPNRGTLSLTLSLNNRLHQTQGAVVANSLFVNEVTASYERLHATVSLEVLHGEIPQARFLVPEGFEVTRVSSPSLSQWAVVDEDVGRVLVVQLQEEAGDEIVLGVVAIRQGAQLDGWSFARLIALDVVGQESIYGIVAERALETQSLSPQGLIPIDVDVIRNALPESVFQVEAGAPPLRSVAAYYAPHREADLQGQFRIPPARLRVTTNLLLSADDAGLTLSGGLALWPEVEDLASFDIQGPENWPLTSVTLEDGTQVPFNRRSQAEGQAVWHVQLPRSIAAGATLNVFFEAPHQPEGWLDRWSDFEAQLPQFEVPGAYRDTGAIAVSARDDLAVRPAVLEHLSSLDSDELEAFGLKHDAINLAYRFERRPFDAQLVFERVTPTITARGFSFFRVESDSYAAYYELHYNVEDARTRTLSFELPPDTPRALSVQGLNVSLKDYSSSEGETGRRWTVHLAEAQWGEIRLAVELLQEFDTADDQEIVLPVIRAADVAYQSGAVAIEGTADYDVQVTQHPRAIDVAELVDSAYQPGRRLLGSYGFVGEPEAVAVRVTRHPGYEVPATIVQRAELLSRITGQGASQTAARYLLRTKARFVEVTLPPRAALLSVLLDDQSLLPQRDEDRLVISLPAVSTTALRDLQLVYEAPIERIGILGEVEIAAPRLALRDTADVDAVEVPTAAAHWDLFLASDLGWDQTGGTLSIDRTAGETSLDRPWLSGVLDSLFTNSHGFNPVRPAREAGRRPRGDDLPASAVEDLPFPPEDSPVFLGGVREDLNSPNGAAVMDDPFAAPGEEEFDARDQDRGPLVIQGQAAPQGAGAFAEPRKKETPMYWAIAGNRSLLIDLTQEVDSDDRREGAHLAFHSLGDDPRLAVRVVDRRRLESLTWAAGLLSLLVGVFLTRRSGRAKVWYVASLLLISLLVPPLLGDSHIAEYLCQALFASGCLLIVFYVTWALAGWRPGRAPRQPIIRRGIGSAATGTALVLIVANLATMAQAQQPPPESFTEWFEALPRTPRPVHIPDEAILVPYDSEQPDGLDRADEVFVPYDKYIELWKLAYGAAPSEKPPAEFALAGGRYEATLSMDGQLSVRGTFELHIFSEAAVDVPLVLEGGVLSSVTIDGHSAQLRSVQPNIAMAATKETTAVAQNVNALTPITVLRTSGPGVKQLALEVRLQLERRGGWRSVQGTLPVGAATALDLTIASDQTEVRLVGAPDQQAFDNTSAGEVIETALPENGSFHWQWRPKVTSGDIDTTLTANSEAVFEIREDGLHLDWRSTLTFRGSGRREFEFLLPEDYFVENIVGPNVRGWDVRDEDQARVAEVTLLSEAQHDEIVSLRLSRRQAMNSPEGSEVRVPLVATRDAALHHGRITIRRSPRLAVRAERVTGASRTDLVQIASLFPDSTQTPVLGIQDFQALQFTSAAPEIVLSVAPEKAEVTSAAQVVLRLSEDATEVEARLRINARKLPVYQLQLGLPLDLNIEEVVAPGAFQYAVEALEDRKQMNLMLPQGALGTFDVVVRGTLRVAEDTDGRSLATVDVQDVASQSGTIVVLTDPAFNVKVDDLQGGSERLLDEVGSWLSAQQRPAARLAIEYRDSPPSGELRLTARKPIVTTEVISNARVTDRSIEETIVIQCQIERAGIREVSFLLPERLQKARIQVPRLRQKTITAAEDREGWVRVRLELEDEVLGELRVLIEHDRLLTSEEQSIGQVLVETGRMNRHYVTLESKGRDEVVVEGHPGLETLEPQHPAWKHLTTILGPGLTQAYVATEAVEPSLKFRTHRRTAVQTVGAQIGLAEATLTVDANGSYRGMQIYHVQNTTEPYLIVELPDEARLWTAHVAEDPVKPTRVAGNTQSLVRIPLVKSSAGDRDYEVRLVYGGRMESLRSLDEVDFPLIRVENIGVQRSQVRLRLPRTHRWYDFDGSMGLVKDDAYQERALLDYGSAQLESLLGFMESVERSKSGSSYESKRARLALESLVQEQSELQGKIQSEGDTLGLKKELLQNGKLLEKARQELRRTDLAGHDGVTLDNRKQLNFWFESQSNMRARNTVDKLGENFSGGRAVTGPQSGEQEQTEFRYLEEHQLAAPQAAKGLTADEYGNSVGGAGQRGLDRDSDGAQTPEGFERVFGVQTMPSLTQQLDRIAPADEANQFQQAPAMQGSIPQVVTGGVLAENMQTRNTTVLARSNQAPLSSLPEVVLDDRGEVYLFSTARGDTQITARAVSESLVERGTRVGLVLAGALSVVLAFRWLRR